MTNQKNELEEDNGMMLIVAYFYFILVILYGLVYFPALGAWGGWELGGLLTSYTAVRVMTTVLGGVIGLGVWYLFRSIIPFQSARFRDALGAVCKTIAKSDDNDNSYLC